METASEGGIFRPLTENPILRLVTVFVFYIFEGVPMGMFYYAIPAYMATQGADATDIAAVVSAFALPWTLKLVNGFIMDRYTYLPMGRRRIWIIGSQAAMALAALTVVVLAPSTGDVALISIIAFVLSAATTMQDVSIDSLVVDILDEKEQAKAGGIMFGGQLIGLSMATAAGGYLLEWGGLRLGFLAMSGFLFLGVIYAIALRERPGEKRLPWSKGHAHRRNLDLQIGAWWPILKETLRAMLAPASLMVIPFLLIRQIPAGVNDVWNPILSSQFVGWDTTQYTNAASLALLGSGMLGLFIGGPLTAKIGALRMMTAIFAIATLQYLMMGLLSSQWSEPWLLLEILWITDTLAIFLAVAIIPLAMQMCSPAVAASQFTLYMALANIGRPIGAQLTSLIGGEDPQAIFLAVAVITGFAAICSTLLWKRHRPAVHRATPQAVPAVGGPEDI